MKFVDLFAGLGGFHHALRELGHECVFASELDDELRRLYALNFKSDAGELVGDIRENWDQVPQHDILCAGFPCQPFSKSGFQHGTRDKTRGTLFEFILRVLGKRRPRFVILENVGNFERHDHGRTWQVVEESLVALGYDVRGTTHVASGGHGLISPHHLGHPHHRERFFVVGSLGQLPADPFPKPNRKALTRLTEVVQGRRELGSDDVTETTLTRQQVDCIDHWNLLLRRLPSEIALPSFPIWGDEAYSSYPFEESTPFCMPLSKLATLTGVQARRLEREELLEFLPSYAREPVSLFPAWKRRFIRQNREWFAANRSSIPREWIGGLREFPPSLRKLEWNCQGEARDLWRCVLQFRPSGLRAKRYTSVPALVAMTTTQIPILGPERRFITRTEGRRLQGLPDGHLLPESRDRAFRALGNAVHVGVIKSIATELLRIHSPSTSHGTIDARLAI